MIEHNCDKIVGKNNIYLTTEDNWVHGIPLGIWVLETVQCSYVERISFCPFCGKRLIEELEEPTTRPLEMVDLDKYVKCFSCSLSVEKAYVVNLSTGMKFYCRKCYNEYIDR